MQRKHLLLLSILLSQTAPVWGMDPVDPIEELDNLIKPSIQRTVDNPDYKKDATKVIFIGDTGRGKTSLIHYLAEKELVSILDSGTSYFLNVKPEDLLPGFDSIGQGTGPGTLFPVSYYSANKNIVLWDCPGFRDPKGVAKEIANAFAIHQLFKSGSPFKVVLVATEGDAKIRSGRAQDFLKLIKRVAEVLPDSASAQGISLVISQQKDFSSQRLLKDIITDINNVSQEPPHGFETGTTAKSLLENLSAQDQSVIFPAPTQGGAYPSNHRDAILNCINLTQPLVNPKVNLVIPDDAKVLVTNYAQKLNDKITDLINTKGLRKTIDICNTQIDNNVNDVRELRANLSQTNAYLSNLKNGLLHLSIVPEDQIKNHLNALFNPNGMTFFPTKKLRGMIETLSFLKSIDPNVTFLTNAWAHNFSTIITQIQQLIKAPEIEVNQNTLTLKGLILGTSDVVEALQHHQQIPINTLNVFSLNTLVIDQDITCPGTALSLIAPNGKVLGNKAINLCGLTGAPGAHGINPGEDGQPGGPGGPGGNLFGFVSNFTNLDHLTVNTSGGPGGTGGNGNAGSNGANGHDGDLSLSTIYRPIAKVESSSVNPNDDKITNLPRFGVAIEQEGEREHDLANFNYHIAFGENTSADFHSSSNGNFTYYNDQGTDGHPGQNGGRGGTGGLGGFQGWSFIDGLNAWNSIAADGTSGASGNAAAGGMGGLHGRHCQGTYETGRTHQVAYTDWVAQDKKESYTAYRTVQCERQVPYEVDPDGTPAGLYAVPGINLIKLGFKLFGDRVAYKTVYYDIQQPYTDTRTITVQVPVTRYRTEALPDVWHVQQGYQPRNPAAAPNGNPGKGLNKNGQQKPIAQVVLDKNDILLSYRDEYQKAVTSPIMATFLKPFPNLKQEPHVSKKKKKHDGESSEESSSAASAEEHNDSNDVKFQQEGSSSASWEEDIHSVDEKFETDESSSARSQENSDEVDVEPSFSSNVEEISDESKPLIKRKRGHSESNARPKKKAKTGHKAEATPKKRMSEDSQSNEESSLVISGKSSKKKSNFPTERKEKHSKNKSKKAKKKQNGEIRKPAKKENEMPKKKSK